MVSIITRLILASSECAAVSDLFLYLAARASIPPRLPPMTFPKHF